MHVIALSGAIEIAPLVGLADVIVDLVETGETLKRNGLSILETIFSVTARLVLNRASLKLRNAEVLAFREAGMEVVREGKGPVP